MLYEDALREVSGKDITLPYWDWTDQASTDATFATDLLGGDGDPNDEYALNDGPFRKDNWQLNLLTVMPNYQGLNPHPWIVRYFGAVIDSSDDYPGYDVDLPTQTDIDNCLSISTYDVAPWDCSGTRAPNSSFRFVLEGFLGDACKGGQAMHNIGHDWIAGFFTLPGVTPEMIPVQSKIVTAICDTTLHDTVPNNVRVGTMEPLDVSPNDPAFFMHHTNVDRIWYLWQQIGDNGIKYEPRSGAPLGYNLFDELYPFDQFKGIAGMDNHGLTPSSMLNAEDLGYAYE
jgi:tyrosinase